MAQPPLRRPVILTVFMEGTANPMGRVTTQIALFARRCAATQLDEQSFQPGGIHGPGSYKLCFDGCGVSHGLRGTLFATGLSEQCEIVHQYVNAFLSSGLNITLNFLGLSRGGIGGLYLAQELAYLDPAKMLMNMLLFDPVPGNFVTLSRYLDFFSASNTNKSMDVSHVPNFGRVLVLYPHEPLPAIAVHAPLLAKFPDGCNLTEDVILGCHQGALFVRAMRCTCLAFACIRNFLETYGTRLELEGHELNVGDAALAAMLKKELSCDEPTSRFAHGPVPGSEIVRYSEGQFLCRAHRELLLRLGESNREAPGRSGAPLYMLDISVPGAGTGEGDFYDRDIRRL